MRPRILLFCLLLAACNDNPMGPTVPLNQHFELAPAQSVVIEDESVSIRFDGVTGDSRCPADAICVQGGDAIVNITVTNPFGGRTPYELHTGDMRSVQAGDLTIELIALVPYPFSAQPIRPEDYRTTLRVTK
jgi:hypothetical protein